MDHDTALVFAGGIIGVASTLATLAIQRKWALSDRQHAYDARALEAAVEKLMAWQAMASAILAGTDWHPAEQRLLDLDARWEADFGLIPDQKSTREILRLSKEDLVDSRAITAAKRRGLQSTLGLTPGRAQLSSEGAP